MAEMKSEILDSCDQIFDEVIDFTKEMVRQYSVLGEEQGVLSVVEDQLRNLGFPVQRVGMPKKLLSQSDLYAPVPWDHENKYNLVSAFNPGASGKSLVFNGHVDVVSATPFDMWTHPHDDPIVKDGWLYGRGSGDMLSGVAAMIYAVHALHRIGYKVASPLNIQAVVEEECSGNGALACLHQGYGGDFVLIPEPFGPQIQLGQVGVLWFKLIARGKSAHVLDTSAGVNAIEKLQLLIAPLKQLEERLNESHYREAPFDRIDHPYNMSIGKFSGGNWASSVPAHAELEGRLGFPVGMSANEAMQLVSDAIEGFTARHPAFADSKPVLRFHGFRSEGHLIDLNAPGIAVLSKCHHALTGAQPGFMTSTATTDLRAFHFYSRTAGTCYGPIAERIHGIDERVNIESIRQTLQTYALFLTEWCLIE